MVNSFDDYIKNGCGRCKLGGTPDCKVHQWTDELNLLRTMVLESELSEEIKWGIPCYTYKGINVLCIAAFKKFCSLSFFKGALLKDDKKLLVKAGENTQANRILKITSIDEIVKLKTTIKQYIFEAIEIEKADLKVDFKQKEETIPVELTNMFKENPALETAFFALTPGRQRGYLLYFAQPKQSKTKIARIESCIAKIIKGEGLHDEYKQNKKLCFTLLFIAFKFDFEIVISFYKNKRQLIF